MNYQPHRHHHGGDHREDRLASWFNSRIFNDRELDQGIIMVTVAVWIIFFSQTLGETAWWAEAFKILDHRLWGFLLGSLGLARVFLSHYDKEKAFLSTVALASCLALAFLGFLLTLVQYKIIASPFFFYLTYQAAKSYVRLTLGRRQAEI